MHPISRAYSIWLGTEEGRNCIEPSILKYDAAAKYLQNRIFHAFHAGANVREKINHDPDPAADVTVQLATGQTVVVIQRSARIWPPDPGYHFYLISKAKTASNGNQP